MSQPLLKRILQASLKGLVILGCLAVVSAANAGDQQSVELVEGSITNHLMLGDGIELDRKLTADSRVVFNPIVGVAYTMINHFNRYWSFKAFFGENCISKPIVGATISYGWQVTTFVDLGLVGGGYGQDSGEWDKRFIETPAFGKGRASFIPMFGGEINFRLPIGTDYFLKLNNLITPIITNHTLSIGGYF